MIPNEKQESSSSNFKVEEHNDSEWQKECSSNDFEFEEQNGSERKIRKREQHFRASEASLSGKCALMRLRSKLERQFAAPI